MEWKFESDIRVCILFLTIFLLFPFNSPDGWSIVVFHLFDFTTIAFGYIYMLIGLGAGFVVSNIIVNVYDKSKRTAPSKKEKKRSK